MVQWNDDYVTVKGEKFHYLRSVLPQEGLRSQPPEGSSRRPLVLLHGHSDNGRCMSPIARRWTETYDVILPDNRGHGRSPRVAQGDTVDNVADHVSILQALGLQDVALGGHSMGAGTAALLAAAHPELVSVLVLEDPPWRAVEPDRGPDTEWFQRTLRLQDMTVRQRIAAEKADHPLWSEEELRVWAPSKSEYDYHYLQVMRPWGGWLETSSCLRCPGILLTADNAQGAIVTPEVAQQVAGVWPQAQVVHIAGAGHNIRRDQAEAYLAAVDAFLAHHYVAA